MLVAAVVVYAAAVVVYAAAVPLAAAVAAVVALQQARRDALVALVLWGAAPNVLVGDAWTRREMTAGVMAADPKGDHVVGDDCQGENAAQRRGDSTGVSTPQRVGRHRRMPCASTLSRLALSFSPSKASGRAESIGGPGGSQGSA